MTYHALFFDLWFNLRNKITPITEKEQHDVIGPVTVEIDP